jgi:hypothetical protein
VVSLLADQYFSQAIGIEQEGRMQISAPANPHVAISLLRQMN